MAGYYPYGSLAISDLKPRMALEHGSSTWYAIHNVTLSK